MNFLDLKADNARSAERIQKAIQGVMDHGRYVLGPEVAELEQQLAEFVGVKHALCVSSGTSALHVALLATGIGPGDEVITAPFSFFATAEVILMAGATPVFVDIDPATYNINPGAIEAAITPSTKVIMPVSMFGQPAEFDAINAIAERHGLVVIEDGAQSFGARYGDAMSCGASTIGCTSFYPTKPFGAMGDGGACFTNDDSIAEAMRLVHNHGQSSHYHHTRLGLNYRMNTMQAAILLAKLPDLPYALDKRRQLALSYHQALQGVIDVPRLAEGKDSVYAQYTVRVDDRADVQQALKQRGIPTAVHYPSPLHTQPAIASALNGTPTYVEAETACQRVMSLPFYPEMQTADVEQVAQALREVLA